MHLDAGIALSQMVGWLRKPQQLQCQQAQLSAATLREWAGSGRQQIAISKEQPQPETCGTQQIPSVPLASLGHTRAVDTTDRVWAGTATQKRTQPALLLPSYPIGGAGRPNSPKREKPDFDIITTSIERWREPKSNDQEVKRRKGRSVCKGREVGCHFSKNFGEKTSVNSPAVRSLRNPETQMRGAHAREESGSWAVNFFQHPT